MRELEVVIAGEKFARCHLLYHFVVDVFELGVEVSICPSREL